MYTENVYNIGRGLLLLVYIALFIFVRQINPSVYFTEAWINKQQYAEQDDVQWSTCSRYEVDIQFTTRIKTGIVGEGDKC